MEIKSKDLKVAIFTNHDNPRGLEENINKWLSENDVTILNIIYNSNISSDDYHREHLYSAMILYK